MRSLAARSAASWLLKSPSTSSNLDTLSAVTVRTLAAMPVVVVSRLRSASARLSSRNVPTATAKLRVGVAVSVRWGAAGATGAPAPDEAPATGAATAVFGAEERCAATGSVETRCGDAAAGFATRFDAEPLGACGSAGAAAAGGGWRAGAWMAGPGTVPTPDELDDSGGRGLSVAAPDGLSFASGAKRSYSTTLVAMAATAATASNHLSAMAD